MNIAVALATALAEGDLTVYDDASKSPEGKARQEWEKLQVSGKPATL